LDAFAVLLEQNSLPGFPRLFIPPALNHSFGNGDASMQALLHDFGIDYVTTRFSRAHQYSPPLYPQITWECGVGLLERGISPVRWDHSEAPPIWPGDSPILPLHWGNLLHSDPQRNSEIVDGWAEMLLKRTRGLDSMLAEDLACCWRQAAVFYLADMLLEDGGVTLNLQAIPDLPCFTGPFFLKIHERLPRSWSCTGAEILSKKTGPDNLLVMKVLPGKGMKKIFLKMV
jgi:hypothetical protein